MLRVWQDPKSEAWQVETAEGIFSLREHRGGLGINGVRPSDARKNHLSFTVHPRSGNDVVIHYEPRVEK